jgi:hypothetical protein
MVDLFRKKSACPPTGTDNPQETSDLALISSRKSILKILLSSNESGNAVGVYLDSICDGMLVVGVENVMTDDDEKIVVFNLYEMSGMILSRTSFSVDEIKAVLPFGLRYQNPVLSRAS